MKKPLQECFLPTRTFHLIFIDVLIGPKDDKQRLKEKKCIKGY